jgi:hypothetical protein
MKLIDEARQEAIESLPGRWREMAKDERQRYDGKDYALIGNQVALAFECAAKMLEVCLQYKLSGET